MREQSPNTKTDKLTQGPRVWTQAEIDLLRTVEGRRVPSSVMRALFPDRSVSASKKKLAKVRGGVISETVIGNKVGDRDPDPTFLDPDVEGDACAYPERWKNHCKKANKAFVKRLRALGMAA